MSWRVAAQSKVAWRVDERRVEVLLPDSVHKHASRQRVISTGDGLREFQATTPVFERLSIRPGDTTELVPGMTMHVMPGIWLDNWGIEISEPVLVTETGVEKLCDLPQGLVIKD